MYVNINGLLEEKGKTKYWLANEIGYEYASLLKLSQNSTRSIQFEILEKLCKALDCKVGDILIIEDES